RAYYHYLQRLRHAGMLTLPGAASLELSFLHAPPAPETPPLSLHDALPISPAPPPSPARPCPSVFPPNRPPSISKLLTRLTRTRRSEEHTSELQSPCNLVCRLLLEKKKIRDHAKQHRSNLTNDDRPPFRRAI